MQIGDLVVTPPNLHWGVGIVIELGTLYGLSVKVQWNDGLPMWVPSKHLEVI